MSIPRDKLLYDIPRPQPLTLLENTPEHLERIARVEAFQKEMLKQLPTGGQLPPLNYDSTGYNTLTPSDREFLRQLVSIDPRDRQSVISNVSSEVKSLTTEEPTIVRRPNTTTSNHDTTVERALQLAFPNLTNPDEMKPTHNKRNRKKK